MSDIGTPEKLMMGTEEGLKRGSTHFAMKWFRVWIRRRGDVR